MTENSTGSERLPVKEIGLICFNIIFVMAGLSIVSPILPQIRSWQEASYTLMGFFVVSFAFGRTIIDIPAGFLVDKLGSSIITVIGMGITAAGSMLSALSPNFYVLVSGRFLAGLGSGLAVTSLQTALLLLSPGTHRARAMSYFMISRRIGSSMFPYVGGLIATWGSWRTVFVLCFLLNLIGTGIAMLQVRLNGKLQGVIHSRKGRYKNLSETDKKAGYLDWELFIIYLLAFVIFLNRDGFERTLIPLFGSTLSFNSAQIGLALTASSVISILGMYLGGKAADRFGPRRTLAVGMVVILAANLLFRFVHDYQFYLLISMIFGIAAFNMALPNVIATDLAHPGKTGQAMGTVRFFNDLGMMTGPLVLTWLTDLRGFTVSFYSNIGLLVIVFLISLPVLLGKRSHTYHLEKGEVKTQGPLH